MSKSRETIPFTIEVDGNSYDCERIVSGTNVLSQKIRVSGLDSTVDATRYGPTQHDPKGMELMAEQLAHEIVVKQTSKAGNSKEPSDME